MPEQWNWQNRDETVGPLTTNELEDLIRQHRVNDSDQIWLAEGGQCISGVEIKRLFTQGTSLAPEVSPSEAASRSLIQLRQVRPKGRVESKPDLGMPGRILRYSAEFIADLSTRFSNILVASFGTVTSRLNSKISLAVLAVIIVLLAIRYTGFIPFESIENQRVYARLNITSERLQKLQQKPIRERIPDEVSLFQSETTLWLEPTIKEMEVRAKKRPISGSFLLGIGAANARSLWNLLGAAKDLNAMVGQVNAASTRSEGFKNKMDIANFHMTGAIPADDPHPDKFRSVASFDGGTAAVILVDLILAIGCVLYWLRTH